RFSYLRLLACSALEAAALTIDEVAWMCDAASVSTQVASHRKPPSREDSVTTKTMERAENQCFAF
ncbi:jg11421, partial [Pararge aegeria aegeria]